MTMKHHPTPIHPHAAYAQLLEHPRLREFLHQRLARLNLQPADIQDIVSQVHEALWRRRGDADPPANVRRLIGLAKCILQGKLVDFYRFRDHEEEHLANPPMPTREDGKEGAPDGRDQPNYVEEVRPPRSITPEDAYDAKEQLVFVQEKIDEGTLTHDDIEVMQAQQAGEKTLEELACERGMTADALRKRLDRIREKLRREWTVRSTRFLVVMMLLWLLLATLAAAAVGRLLPPPSPPQLHQDHTDVQRTRGAAPVTRGHEPTGTSAKPPLGGH